MADRVAVFVYATDQILQQGLTAQLRGRPELDVVDSGDIDRAQVALVAVDSIDESTLCAIRGIQRDGCPRVIVVVTTLDDAGLLAAVEAGVSGLLRRSDATPEALTSAVVAAVAGEGTVPPDLLGRLLSQVGQLQRQVLAPRGLLFNGLSEREVSVLRLVANGCDTAEIASELAYSERTIKNVIHDVTVRLNLRSRAHAVAYAVREGLI